MKVLIEGPILTQSGYGEHARLVYRSLKDTPELDLYISPLEWGQTPWISLETEEKKEIDKIILRTAQYENSSKLDIEEYDLQIHIGLLSELKKKAKKVVCVTAGSESNAVSYTWLLKTIKEVNKIIVPSEHSKRSFINSAYQMTKQSKDLLRCQCPVDVVPYPVKTVSKPKDADLGLSTKFNFLTIAVHGPRKNLINLTKWFIREFREESSVGLILKTGLGKNSILDKTKTTKIFKTISDSEGPRKCKIYIIHGDMTEEEIHSLYKNRKIKGFVLTSHGEGYCLPTFEAAYSGMPIVATNWSGHLDYLTGEKGDSFFLPIDYKLDKVPASAVWRDVIIEDSMWANPKESSCRQQLRKLFENYKSHKRQAGSLKKKILRSHREDKILKKMKNSILSIS